MASSWKRDRANERIDASVLQVSDVEICDYVRDTALEGIPSNRAYRVYGAHVYIDILNLNQILGTTNIEGETCHRRALRFLDLHQRAVHRILKETDAIRVDFHNQRLHAVLAKPYGDDDLSATGRVHRAVAISQPC